MEQFRIFRFKQVDISLETSDSEPTSISAQHQQLQERGRSLHPESGSRSRSKSPRPQTLPGLVKASNKSTSPTVILQFYTIRKVKFLSENSILTRPQHFHEFFHPNYFWQFFSWNQSCQQLKSPKPQHFHEFFTQKNRQFSWEIKVEFLDKKWRFRTVCRSWFF